MTRLAPVIEFPAARTIRPVEPLPSDTLVPPGMPENWLSPHRTREAIAGYDAMTRSDRAIGSQRLRYFAWMTATRACALAFNGKGPKAVHDLLSATVAWIEGRGGPEAVSEARDIVRAALDQMPQQDARFWAMSAASWAPVRPASKAATFAALETQAAICCIAYEDAIASDAYESSARDSAIGAREIEIARQMDDLRSLMPGGVA